MVDDHITLFRAVSDDEMYDIVALQGLRQQPAYYSMEGKCFTSTLDCAIKFGKALMNERDHVPYYVVAVTIQSTWLRHMTQNANQDTICPSSTLSGDLLEKFNKNIARIEVVLAGLELRRR